MDALRGAADLALSYGPSQPVSGAASQPRTEPAYMPSGAVSRMYASNLEIEREPAAAAAATLRAVPSIFRPSTSPASIARELGIRPHYALEQLLSIRRRFALRNHPDRAAPDQRDVATVRMSIANRLVDEAIEALGVVPTV
jgi:hypothetical protein